MNRYDIAKTLISEAQKHDRLAALLSEETLGNEHAQIALNLLAASVILLGGKP